MKLICIKGRQKKIKVNKRQTKKLTSLANNNNNNKNDKKIQACEHLLLSWNKTYSALSFSSSCTKQKINLSCPYMVLLHTVQWIVVKVILIKSYLFEYCHDEMFTAVLRCHFYKEIDWWASLHFMVGRNRFSPKCHYQPHLLSRVRCQMLDTLMPALNWNA